MATRSGDDRAAFAYGNMTDQYEIVDVTAWSVQDTESVGGDEKVWLADPLGQVWLFKPRTERPDRIQGEDWAEKIAAEIARQLGIPAAHVELAIRDGVRGTISLNLRPDGWERQHGDVLLAELVLDYRPKTRDRHGHDLNNIARALDNFGPPLGTDPSLPMTAFEVFAGYLVFDALIANQDRHEQNWAVLRPLPGEGTGALAGSYDHGSCLGFNLTDVTRQFELDREGINRWAGRATAQRFDQATDGQLTLVELACAALSQCSPAAREHWLSALEALGEALWDDIIDRIPELSDPTRTFVGALLDINRRRLLDEC